MSTPQTAWRFQNRSGATCLTSAQSRAAIARLGAKQDGVLRSHSVMSDGSLRDTAVYSIIQSEWPGVRNELRRRLALHH